MHLSARHFLIVLADPCSVYSAGRGLGRARAASRPAGLLLVSFFYPKSAVFFPDPLAHVATAMLMQTPIPPQGASRGQHDVIYFGCFPASVVVPPKPTRCVTAPQT